MTVRTLYHGGYPGRNHKPSAVTGGRKINFGPGLYFTDVYEEAERYSIAVARAQVRIERPIRLDQQNPELQAKLMRALRIEPGDLDLWWEYPLVGIFDLAQLQSQMGMISSTKLMRFLQKLGYDCCFTPIEAIRSLYPDMPVFGNYYTVFDIDQVLSWEQLPSRVPTR